MIRMLCYLFIIFAPYLFAASEYSYYQSTHEVVRQQHCIYACSDIIEVEKIEAVRQLVHAVVIECIVLFTPREKEKKSIIPQEYKAILLMHTKFRPQNARCNINTETNICSK